MSSTTGEHINELEERRRRRQERNAAQPGQAKPPRSANTALEARDLLRDLITNGSRARRNGRGLLYTREASERRTAGTVRSRRRANANPPLVRNAEGVDELVRRVQAGAQTAADEAERATRRGRPIGTADLSADAASRNPARSRAGRRAVEATLRAVAAKPAGLLGGRDCHRPSRGRRPCAVVGVRGRTPDRHDPKPAKPGDGGRSRIRRADNDQQGRPRARGVDPSSN